MPQTLGLEPIVCDAYRYTPAGELRGYDELAGLAQQLAAGKRWIAEGAVPVWAATFMEQAQAILFFDTARSRLARSDPRRPSRNDVRALEQLARDHFPQKLLYLTMPGEIRALRKVRALPPDEQAPGPSFAEGPGA